MAVKSRARKLRRAVFLDKDGTLVEDVPFNVDARRLRLGPGADEALPRLARAGFVLAVVSNQSGVARGYFAEDALAGVARDLGALVAGLGVTLDGFYYCPHHPEGRVAAYRRDCECRKPRPGLLERAARDLDVDLAASWLVGDILDDVEAGRRAGCRTILIDNGNETEWRLARERLPHHAVANLAEAARLIVALDVVEPSAAAGRQVA
ncbi:MAG TPA: HAD family hydrolase [Gammaproteobacteria bacterium]